jgi:hypothetical protein
MIKKLITILFTKSKPIQEEINPISQPSIIKDEFEIGAESIVNNWKPFKNWILW